MQALDQREHAFLDRHFADLLFFCSNVFFLPKRAFFCPNSFLFWISVIGMILVTFGFGQKSGLWIAPLPELLFLCPNVCFCLNMRFFGPNGFLSWTKCVGMMILVTFGQKKRILYCGVARAFVFLPKRVFYLNMRFAQNTSFLERVRWSKVI